jgi:hypothetical protein
VEETYAAKNSYTKDPLPEDEAAPLPITPVVIKHAADKTVHQPGTGLFTSHVIQLLISSWVMYFMNSE